MWFYIFLRSCFLLFAAIFYFKRFAFHCAPGESLNKRISAPIRAITFCLDTKSNKKVKRPIARRPATFSIAKSKELAALRQLLICFASSLRSGYAIFKRQVSRLRNQSANRRHEEKSILVDNNRFAWKISRPNNHYDS